MTDSSRAQLPGHVRGAGGGRRPAFALLQSLVVPVLPTLQADLHTTQNTVTWVLTAYLLSASIFTPIMGRIGDMIGKERVFVATLVALAARLAAGRAGAPNVGGDDRRPGHPGHRRRRAAAGLRHHPRRVPAREGVRRGRRDRLADRGRRRPGHRAGRPDRRRARLPLAVLAADDPDRRRGRRRPSSSSPSRRCAPPGRISWLPAVLLSALAGRAAGRAERGAGLGLGFGQGDRPARRRRRARRGLGRRPSCAPRRR